MTRRIWIGVLDQFTKDGTATEKRLAELALDLIQHPEHVELILDRHASNILEETSD